VGPANGCVGEQEEFHERLNDERDLLSVEPCEQGIDEPVDVLAG
jgi:hypothetical protein